MNTEWNEINEEDREYMINEGCDIGEYEGEIFFIVTGWDIVDSPKFNQYFKDSDNWGFNDEYSICYECYNTMFRISPSSYDWRPEFYDSSDNGYICAECAQDYIDDAIQEIQDKIDNGEKMKSFPIIFDLDDAWHQIFVPEYPNTSWQNGMHHGMNDDPLRQGKMIRELKFHGDSIFQVVFRVYPSQFNIDWDTFIRLDPNLDLEFSNEDIKNIAAEFGTRFNSREGQFPYDQASLYEAALKNIKHSYSSISIDPDNGTIDINGTDNLNEYLENRK